MEASNEEKHMTSMIRSRPFTPTKMWGIAIVAILAGAVLLEDLPGDITNWDNTAKGSLAADYLRQGQIPPPVDLPIQNIPQETNVWCWAAVSQQIIMATKGQHGTPPQCALVGMSSGVGPHACCQNRAACTRTGSLTEIQALIQQFGGRSSSINAPTDPLTLYQTLANGHAIVLAVQSSPYAGHVVVLRGMGWQPGPNGLEPVLFINDPMAYFTQPMPFSAIARYWQAAIVIS